MELAILAFCVLFLLIASGGLILFYREAMSKRIAALITPSEKQRGLKNTLKQTGFSLGVVVEQFERLLPKSQAEVSIVQQRLIRAGFRKDSAVKLFYGAKVLVPLALCAIALVSGIGSKNTFLVYAAALGLGFLSPDFWLGKMISKRQARIRLGLPDVLDLLVICIGGRVGPGPGNRAHRQGIEPLAAGHQRRVKHRCAGAARRSPAFRCLEAYGGTHRRRHCAQPCYHAGPIGTVRNKRRQDFTHPF